MTKTSDPGSVLRRRAEALWQQEPATPCSDADTQRLLQALEIHQIELELQTDLPQGGRRNSTVAICID